MPPLSRRLVLAAAGAALLSACAGRRQRRVIGRRDTSGASLLQASPAQPKGLLYTVEKGDTLSAIARRCDLQVQEIIGANQLTSPHIRIGQRLLLPGVTGLHADPLAQVTMADTPAPEQPLYQRGPGGYQLVRRRQWTRQGLRKNHRAMGSIHRITVHHTGEHGNMAQASDLEVVKRIENYHRNERKWAAIGYHFLVGRDGRVYEGRPETVQGAHTRSNNRNNLGISVIGDFNRKLPSQRQLDALAALLDDKKRHYGIPQRLIFGHRDLSPSVCPGARLYAWLQAYKRRA